MASGANWPIKTACIFRNPHIAAALRLAHELTSALRAYGVTVWECDQLDDVASAARLAETDLVLTLGGDGSLLRAARASAGHQVLLVGINLGRVGFLTEAEPEDWPTILPRLLGGDYWVEERMMLQMEGRRGETRLAQGLALNDVVVGHGTPGSVLRMQVHIDGDLLAGYVADALIVATPTGSTAYALAAGGPIMPPQQRNILLVPVAPHLSLDRAVVLAEGVRVRVVVQGHNPAALAVDGQVMGRLEPGDAVHVQASAEVARFARVRPRDYFYRDLLARLVPKEREAVRSTASDLALQGESKSE